MTTKEKYSLEKHPDMFTTYKKEKYLYNGRVTYTSDNGKWAIAYAEHIEDDEEAVSQVWEAASWYIQHVDVR